LGDAKATVQALAEVPVTIAPTLFDPVIVGEPVPHDETETDEVAKPRLLPTLENVDDTPNNWVVPLTTWKRKALFVVDATWSAITLEAFTTDNNPLSDVEANVTSPFGRIVFALAVMVFPFTVRGVDVWKSCV
jgi:hypothetical protein